MKLKGSMSSVLQLTSQHPYAEVFIGRPHVWTVDLNNREEVEDAVKAILNQKVAVCLFVCFSTCLHLTCALEHMWDIAVPCCQ